MTSFLLVYLMLVDCVVDLWTPESSGIRFVCSEREMLFVSSKEMISEIDVTEAELEAKSLCSNWLLRSLSPSTQTTGLNKQEASG